MDTRSRRRGPAGWVIITLVVGGATAGCQTARQAKVADWAMRDAVERYAAVQADRLAIGGAARGEVQPSQPGCGLLDTYDTRATTSASERSSDGARAIPTLGTFALDERATATAPTTPSAAGAAPAPREGYWRQDIWHQMGHESLDFGKRGFWQGFKTSYWNLENALVLTATMGASITFRETGVDTTIAHRARGHRQLGDMDETIQIIGNPVTHFSAAGVLWLGSALTQDMKKHEVAKSMIDALAVNGASTLLLKAATNTSAPNGDRHAWPSGHTSSAFTAAAVLNEYYGPWVGIPSLALAGLVGYQRIDSRVHDFSDVVFGGMMGYIIGTSIARDQKAQFPEVFGMKLIPYVDPETGSSGLALWKQF